MGLFFQNIKERGGVMLFEITSSVLMGSVMSYTYFSQSGMTSDAAKIQRICANCGLTVKERGHVKTIHLQRKTRHDWGTEYVYRIPLGLSFQDFERKKEHLQDGLNNKSRILDITLQDFKKLDLKRNLIKQIRKLLEKKKLIKKEIELSYDGMLRIKVYHEPLTELFSFDESLFSKCKGWEIPIGLSRVGLIKHDFELGHMIVAGLTRYGKSVFLKNTVTTLVHRHPEHSKFTLIDLKGGLTFNRFKYLPQVRSMSKDVSETLTALRDIQKEMEQRMESLLESGYEDINEANQKERHFIIIDEAAEISSHGETDKELKKMKVECENIVADIARRGAGVGYRLVYCTQYPTNETIRSQVRQNCDTRLCFRLKTEVASRAVLDEGGAEGLPLIKGRAIYLTDRKQIVQTPFIENKFIDKTIKPHIVIKARKDDDGAESRAESCTEGNKGGTDTFILEET